MFASLISWFVGGGASGLAGELRKAYAARLEAATDEAKIAADERMAQLERQVEAQTRGAGSWWAKFVRFGFAFPYIAYLNWLIIHDKIMGAGATDPLSPMLERILMIIVAFYFLDNTIRLIRR